MNPLISVVIPVLNGEDSLSFCIQSLKDQSFAGFEVIVVDGNSTDGSSLLARQLLEAGSIGFTVESKADRCVYEAMNRGIAISRGEWIYFLGCDDILYCRESFESIYTHLLDDYTDLVIANVSFDDMGCHISRQFDFHEILHRNFCQQAILYRKRLFDRLGNFNTRYRIYADWDFNIRCFLSGTPYRFVDVILARYNTSGLSSRAGDQIFHNELRLNEFLYRFRFSSGVGKFKYLDHILLCYVLIQYRNLMFMCKKFFRFIRLARTWFREGP